MIVKIFSLILKKTVIVKNSTNINKNSDNKKIPLISTKKVIVKNSTNINKNSDSKKNSTNINKKSDSKKFHQYQQKQR